MRESTMRILFWADGFWPRIGGAETFGLRLVEALQKRGHQCQVLAQKDHPDWKEEEIYRGIPIHRVDFDPILDRNNLKKIGSIRESLQSIQYQFKPDLIYLNTLARGSALSFILFQSLFSVPTVAGIHSPYWESIPPLVKKLCLSLDSLCCVSDWVLQTMERFLPEYREKLERVYNGLPTPNINPTKLPFDPPKILLLGRLSYEKGFDTAIEAFSLLRKNNPTAQLLIAGEGPERPYLNELVKKFDLKDSAQFTGEISVEKIYSIINLATFVVVPSHFEAFGLVALESMFMKRPVIASDIGGLREIIIQNITGLLVPAKDPLAFQKAMETLLEEPQKTIEMGIEGRKRALTTFSLEENLNRYETVFENLLGIQ